MLRPFCGVLQFERCEPPQVPRTPFHFGYSESFCSVKMAVELRPCEMSRRLLQELIGLPTLSNLTFERLHLGGHVGRQARLAPAVTLGLAMPLVQRLRLAADLRRNRHVGRASRRALGLAVEHHSHRALARFGRKRVRRLACHGGSSFSGVKPSGKPRTIHTKT